MPKQGTSQYPRQHNPLQRQLSRVGPRAGMSCPTTIKALQATCVTTRASTHGTGHQTSRGPPDITASDQHGLQAACDVQIAPVGCAYKPISTALYKHSLPTTPLHLTGKEASRGLLAAVTTLPLPLPQAF